MRAVDVSVNVIISEKSDPGLSSAWRGEQAVQAMIRMIRKRMIRKLRSD